MSEIEEKKNPCISYSKLRLFWNDNNPSSALANPDVDSFKIIAQHNTAVTLINLPLPIPQTLIQVSILKIEFQKKKKKNTTLTPDSVLCVSL